MTIFRVSRFENWQQDFDVSSVFAWINTWSDVIEVDIASAGTEVDIEHGMEIIPSFLMQVVTADTTGTGVVYPGGTAWDREKIYITATVAGTYHIVLRR